MGCGPMPELGGRRFVRIAVVAIAVLVAGCASGGQREMDLEGRNPSALDWGMGFLAIGEWAAADSTLRVAASACGPEGLDALLLLSALQQDPRNPRANPDSAALMAARHILRTGGMSRDRLMAEGLYLQALDRGGDPSLRPDGSWPDEGNCPTVDPDPLRLPDLPAPALSRRLVLAQSRLDSLHALHQADQARIGELEAELARIRRLLQRPDTSRLGGRPGG